MTVPPPIPGVTLAPILPGVTPLPSLVRPLSEAALISLLRTGALQRTSRRSPRPAYARPWPR